MQSPKPSRFLPFVMLSLIALATILTIQLSPLSFSAVPKWGIWGLALTGGAFTALLCLISFNNPTFRYTPPPPNRLHSTKPVDTPSSISLTRQGFQYLEQGDKEKAYRFFNEAIVLDPSNAYAWTGQGVSAPQATERHLCFKRAYALNPKTQNKLREEP